MTGSDQSFQLFKTSLTNKDYIASVCKNETSETEFIESLWRNAIRFDQSLQLLGHVSNRRIKSLIVFYILCNESFLNNLEGESLLAHLPQNKHSSSRLNPLIQMLDPSMLSKQRIARLPTESAVSILCCISHFHKFDGMQLKALLMRYPHTELLRYWLTHFYYMPNAFNLLQHFLRLTPQEVVLTPIQTNLNPDGKRLLGLKMIAHLELFDPKSILLQGDCQELFLIEAIKQYLHGHQHPNYQRYISLTAEKLLTSPQALSVSAIQQLIALHAHSCFQQLNDKTAYLTNYYLRKNAQSGTITIFYEKGAANTQSMIQKVQLGALTPKTTLDLMDVPEHSVLIDNLSKLEKPLSALDYFLVHYVGDLSRLRMVIRDYLQCNAPETVESMAFLLSRLEVAQAIKNEIFESFLQFPALFNDNIACYLLQYNASALLAHFSNDYQQVIHLCSLGLEQAETLSPALQDMLKQAKKEAEFEQSNSQETGFFWSIINRLKRCWQYGWTGFFKPNKPLYVSAAAKQTGSVQAQEPCAVVKEDKITSLENNLNDLLLRLKSPYSIQELNELVGLLQAFSLEKNPENEIALRTAVHQHYHLIAFEAKQQPLVLGQWLNTNQEIFIQNRFRLLETLLACDRQSPEDLLFSDLDDKTPLLAQIKSELSLPLPKEKKQVPEDSTGLYTGNYDNTREEVEKALAEASHYVSSLANSALGFLSNTTSSFFGTASSLPDTGPTHAEKNYPNL